MLCGIAQTNINTLLLIACERRRISGGRFCFFRGRETTAGNKSAFAGYLADGNLETSKFGVTAGVNMCEIGLPGQLLSSQQEIDVLKIPSKLNIKCLTSQPARSLHNWLDGWR